MFNSGLGSANFLNLDHLVITDLRITDLEVSPAGTVRLTWDSVSGVSYQVQYTTQLPGGAWTNLGSPVPAMGATTSKTDTLSGSETRYYRVQIPRGRVPETRVGTRLGSSGERLVN